MRIGRFHMKALAAAMLTIGMLVSVACTGGAAVSAQDIQGWLQAMEGKEMVIKLDDGSMIRVSVENTQTAAQAVQLIGERVKAKVEVEDNGERRLMNRVDSAGEDTHFTGAIESIGADTWVIGGKTVKINSATMIDGGLAVGVTAEVEAAKLADGSLLAYKIETDAEDEHFSSAIQSITADTAVIGGRTFKINATTRVDEGLKAGVLARVEFMIQPDGSLLAIEIETDEEDEKITGVIQSIAADSAVIGGKTFKVNDATRLDEGLAAGVTARVEFITMADGSLLAIEIETDQEEEQSFGAVESMGNTAWVVGGKTFKVDADTRIESGLVIGSKARVKFVSMADGSLLATRIQIDKRGSGAEDDSVGAVKSMNADSWVVGGKTFRINAATEIEDNPGASSQVKVRFTKLDDGTLLATKIEVEDSSGGGTSGSASSEAEDFHFIGAIESMGADAWVVGGKTFKITPVTMLDTGLAVGVKVDVEFVLENGQMVAAKIETPEAVSGQAGTEAGENFQFEGVIQAISPGMWSIGGKSFKVDAATMLDNGLAIGVLAKVEFVVQADGSLLARGIETSLSGEMEVEIETGSGKGK